MKNPKDFQIALENAKKNLQTADHMLTITHQFINDPKLLLVITEKVSNALTNTMRSLLYYELYYKKIPPFKDDFINLFNIFKARSARRYNFDKEYIFLIQDVYEIIKKHKKSPVEFRRQDKFVICTEDFDMKVISAENIGNYIKKAKSFIREVEHKIRIK